MTHATALIAEDEPLLAAGLAAELKRLWPELQIVAQVGNGDSALQQALALAPSVCFMDIRMPGSTGLQAAQAMAEDWPSGTPFPLLVFVTAYEQYAVEAFQAQAVDYLLKPVQPERLAECVQRLQQRLASRANASAELAHSVEQLRALLGVNSIINAGAGLNVNPTPRLEVIQAQVGAVVHMVPVDEVIYFEAADKYLRVVTAEREHLIRMSLRELLAQLDTHRFWQIHRGTVVHARCVRSARRDESGKVYLSLKGCNDTLVASRLYAHLFKGM